MIIKTLGRKTWEVKFSDSEVLGRLKLSQLLRPKDPPTEAPAEATILEVLPLLSDHDSKGSGEGCDEGSCEVECLDDGAPDKIHGSGLTQQFLE